MTALDIAAAAVVDLARPGVALRAMAADVRVLPKGEAERLAEATPDTRRALFGRLAA